ncbi:DUF7845 domain-containing protein [Halorarum salinum]|uniref:DUF7845 domain-containing protein n=1 Tax=Halorarum salinum TaxID=2743089 RepID=A0A7D5LAY2_9EURY|nr:hypothetical protein [Halobaculum salinum]QLG62191.1 hypothetical protein HUG12_10785 [Halobaculum salinum]
MSLDAPTPAEPPTDNGGLLRLEGITTTTEQLPEPTRHGGNLHVVLNDQYRPAAEIEHDSGDRDLPDGSAYQTARARWYEAADADEVHTVETPKGYEREYVVLEDEYELFDEPVAVTLNSSRCELGQVTSAGNFRAYFKYNLTLKPLDDDGEVRWFGTPTTSLNVTIRPQDAGLARKTQEEGIVQKWSPPYGSGTEIRAQTTWAESTQEIQGRIETLLYDVLGYEWDDLDAQNESRTFWKSEVHHRVAEEVAPEIVHTMRQSAELLARHEADLKEETVHSEGTWKIVKLRTDGWEQLGFPILRGQDVQIKLYMPDAPAEYLEYPMDQPKVEVSLEGRPRGGDAYHVDRWEQITHVLESILLSHLRWADVGTEHILQDDMSLGPAADLLSWEHPEGRRAWLRDHYESLTPRVYAEARKSQTTAVYDILHSIKRRDIATYAEIAQDVGLVERTVRGHVARLTGTAKEPGILKTIPDAVTFVTFSAEWWEDDAREALDRVYPNDTAEDRSRRRQTRVEERLLKRTLGLTPASSSSSSDGESEDDQVPIVDVDDDSDQEDDRDDDDRGRDGTPDQRCWRYFHDVDLDGAQLGIALDRGYLPEDHVRVRIDDSPLFSGG